MTGEVCTKCECYITPPNPWFGTVPPKMCQCSSWKYSRDKEAIQRMMEIDRQAWERIHDAIMNVAKKQDEQLGLLKKIESNTKPRTRIDIGPL